MKRTLGILGGMGPLATVDFMRKVIDLTPATRDQDHIPMVVASIPQVPDRTAAILGDGESPLPVMLDAIRLLNLAAVDAVAIPCNTAHYWFEDLVRESRAPILHIVDAACAVLEDRARGVRTVGLMGTTGSIKSGIYQQRIEAHGHVCLVPNEDDQESLVMGGIYKIKAGDLGAARRLLEWAADGLRARGAGAIVLGCTEIPIVIEDGGDVVDATRALAAACVRRFAAADATP